MQYFLKGQNELYNHQNYFNLDVTGDPSMEAAYPKTHRHAGCDYGCHVGTPIFAPADGTAVSATFSKVKGNVLIYSFDYNGKNYGLEFCHLRELPATGPKKEGEIIGYTGATGSACFGAHLHSVMWLDTIVAKRYQEIFAAGQAGWREGSAKIQQFISEGKLIDNYKFFKEALG